MVKVIYDHIDGNGKPERAYVQMRVEPDSQEQELLERWIRHVSSGKDHREFWVQRARAMSKKATDYHWFTGEQNELKKPWFDQEKILFMDPQRPSIMTTTGTIADGTAQCQVDQTHQINLDRQVQLLHQDHQMDQARNRVDLRHRNTQLLREAPEEKWI
jgi:hypothetical protein